MCLPCPHVTLPTCPLAALTPRPPLHFRPVPVPEPKVPNQIPDGRDLRPENVSLPWVGLSALAQPRLTKVVSPTSGNYFPPPETLSSTFAPLHRSSAPICTFALLPASPMPPCPLAQARVPMSPCPLVPSRRLRRGPPRGGYAALYLPNCGCPMIRFSISARSASLNPSGNFFVERLQRSNQSFSISG